MCGLSHQKCWEVHVAISETYLSDSNALKTSVKRPKRKLLISLHFHHNSHTDFSPSPNFINEKNLSFHDVTRMFDVGRFYLEITFMNIPMLIISDFYDLHNIFRKLISWLGFLKETVIKKLILRCRSNFSVFLQLLQLAEFQRRIPASLFSTIIVNCICMAAGIVASKRRRRSPPKAI